MSSAKGRTATGRRRRRRSLLSVCGALTGVALTVVPLSTATVAGAATSSSQGKATRVSAWSPSMTTGGPSFDNQTIRMVVHSSLAGSGARITLSNRYSSAPLDGIKNLDLARDAIDFSVLLYGPVRHASSAYGARSRTYHVQMTAAVTPLDPSHSAARPHVNVSWSRI